MPKIIENLEARLIEEAKRQVEENGYALTTIRSIATAVGVGIGTVYNYFPSKDALLASYLLEDWTGCVRTIEEASCLSHTPAPVVQCICEQLLLFARRHQSLFRDESAAASFAASFGRYHTMLRTQLAQPLKKFCADDFTAQFIAESLLCWTMAGKDFDQLYAVIEPIFRRTGAK